MKFGKKLRRVMSLQRYVLVSRAVNFSLALESGRKLFFWLLLYNKKSYLHLVNHFFFVLVCSEVHVHIREIVHGGQSECYEGDCLMITILSS